MWSECTRRARCLVKSQIRIFRIPSVSAVVNLPNKYLKNEKPERSSLEFQTGHISLGVPFTHPQENKRYQTRARSEWKNDKIKQGDRTLSPTRKIHRYGMLYCVRNVVAHGDARQGKWRGNWRMEGVTSTLTPPRQVVYSALLKLMRTARLPAVDWTDYPAYFNGLVRLGGRQSVVSARVPSGSARALLYGTTGQVGPRPPRYEVSRSQAIIHTRVKTHKHARTHGRTPPNDSTSCCRAP